MSDTRDTILALPGWSPLTHQDELAMRTLIASEPPRWDRSWLYLLRQSHSPLGSLGLKCVMGDVVTVAGLRSGRIYLVPVYDATGGRKLIDLCASLQDATGLEILVRLAEPVAPHSALKLYRGSSAGDVPRRDTQLLLSRILINNRPNPAADNFSRRARHFESLGISLRISHDLTEFTRGDYASLLLTGETGPNKYAAYLPLIDYLSRQPAGSQPYRTMIFSYEGHVVGLYLAEILSKSHAGLYCGVTTRRWAGGTEWMDLAFFRALAKEHITTLLLGDAETGGVDSYVGKLLAINPKAPLRTYVFDPASAIAPARSKVRPAAPTDVTRLASLYRRFYNSLSPLDEHWTAKTSRALISHFLSRQPDLFLVAEANDQLVGGIVAAVQPWWDGNHLVEGELFMDHQFMLSGIDETLIKALLNLARAKYQVVAWDTIIPTVDRHPLGNYENLGFDEVKTWKAVSADIGSVLSRLNRS